jgi:hypothetical protein
MVTLVASSLSSIGASLGNEIIGTVDEEKGVNQRGQVPWAFRLNEVIPTWFGMQIGICQHFLLLKLTKIVCEHHRLHMMQILSLKKKTSIQKTAVCFKQSVKSLSFS